MHLLSKNHYHLALEKLRSVNVNHLFARFVLEEHVNGKVFCNDPLKPEAFHVVHPYGMSLLFGSCRNSFKASLKSYLLNEAGERNHAEWLQAFPADWNPIIASLLGGSLVNINNDSAPAGLKQVEQHTRANFKFNKNLYNQFLISKGPDPYPIVPVNTEIFKRMKGTVVPENFWNHADDFIKKGKGFSMLIDDNPVCTAYSAYIFDGLLELGIETYPRHRGKGYAIHTCAALINYCIENHYEPIWSCRLQNTGSYLLAQKLGFEPILTLPYYLLPV